MTLVNPLMDRRRSCTMRSTPRLSADWASAQPGGRVTRNDTIFLMLMSAALGFPLSILALNLQRMRRRARSVAFVGEDLIQLLGEGDFRRAASRLNEIGGSLGREVQELLFRLLQQPWVGAGEAVRIAGDQVEPRGGRALGVVAGLATPVGAFLSFTGHAALTELAGYAIVWFGSISFAVILAMPFCADHFKLRIIRSIHEVQHAAEKWLSEHREPGERSTKV